MKDYFCTERSMEKMRTLSPDDIEEYIFTESSPEGFAIIHTCSTIYLAAVEDFQADSRIVQYDPYMPIEYFENGIPEWLNPLPGLRTYYADWTGSTWEFTKASGI